MRGIVGNLINKEFELLMDCINSNKSKSQKDLWDLFYRYWRFYACINHHLKNAESEVDKLEIFDQFVSLHRDHNALVEPIAPQGNLSHEELNCLEYSHLDPTLFTMLTVMREERDEALGRFHKINRDKKKKGPSIKPHNYG